MIRVDTSDLLFLVGVTTALVGAWGSSWQAGLMGTGLLLIASSWIVRGLAARGQTRRRGRR